VVWGIGSISPIIATGSTGNLPASEIKNVIVIILDALRADHLGIYGYPRDTSPNIDRLAEKGLVFDRAIVQAGWTKPSIASLFTSTYPGIHQAVTAESRLPKKLMTMAEIFRNNGYFTVGFVNNRLVDTHFGFDRGFQAYKRTSPDHKIIEKAWFTLTRKFIDPGLLDEEDIRRLTAFLREKGNGNIISNYGFEDKIEGWNAQTAWLERGPAHSGDCAIHLRPDMISSPNFWQLRQLVTLKHGTDYIFGAFVKTRNLNNDVKIELREVFHEARHLYVHTNNLGGDNDWTLLLGVFRPQSGDLNFETEVEIRAGRMTDFREGDLWLDDVFIIPIDRFPLFHPAEKVFCYLHFLDPHAPYVPPIPYLNSYMSKEEPSLIDRYDAEIKALDAKLGLFLEGLESRDILDETLVIITADHGEAFGEHGVWKHGAREYFYDEVARVPLIMYNPRLFPSPGRVEETVSVSVDLLPSLVDLLNLKVPPSAAFQGVSIFSKGKTRSPYAFFYENDDLRMVTDRKWKYIKETDLDYAVLFDLIADPGEANNVIELFPKKSRELRQIIDERISAHRDFKAKAGPISGGKAEITAPLKDQLRALGYLN